MSKTFKWAFWTSIGLLNLTVIASYVLWSIADTWAADRSELHGFDQSQLLPNDTAFWLVANCSVVMLIVCDVLILLVAVRLTRKTRALEQAQTSR